jgi:hypothetical protein
MVTSKHSNALNLMEVQYRIQSRCFKLVSIIQILVAITCLYTQAGELMP